MDNGVSESDSDTDLGSGGALLLPAMKDSLGATWDLAVGAGKDTNLYVVNRNSMGKFNSSSNKIYQELAGVLPGGLWSMPAFWSGRLYFGPVSQPILEFQFKQAKLATAASGEDHQHLRLSRSHSQYFLQQGLQPNRMGGREHESRGAVCLQRDNAGRALQQQSGCGRTRSLSVRVINSSLR